jgi:hypothetical protein
MEKSDHRHRRLLCPRRERPRRRAAEQRDEIAPSHASSLPGQRPNFAVQTIARPRRPVRGLGRRQTRPRCAPRGRRCAGTGRGVSACGRAGCRRDYRADRASVVWSRREDRGLVYLAVVHHKLDEDWHAPARPVRASTTARRTAPRRWCARPSRRASAAGRAGITRQRAALAYRVLTQKRPRAAKIR